MRLPSSQPDHRASEQLRDAIDDIAVSHRHPQDRSAWSGWSAAEKSPLALKDPYERVELKLFYVVLCLPKLDLVSRGL